VSGVNLGDQVLLLLGRVKGGSITEFLGEYFDDGERIR
jgi:hypothetical protein